MEMSCRQKKGQSVEKVTSGSDLGVTHIQAQVKPSETLFPQVNELRSRENWFV